MQAHSLLTFLSHLALRQKAQRCPASVARTPSGRKAARVAEPPVLVALWPAAGNRLPDGPDHQPANMPCIAKAYIRLGGMHIDIHLMGIKVDEQHHAGVATAKEIIGIGSANGPKHHLVPHGASIDKDKLLRAIGAV